MRDAETSKTTGRWLRPRTVVGPVAALGVSLFLQSLPKGKPVSTPKGILVTTTLPDEVLLKTHTPALTPAPTPPPQIALIEALEGRWSIRNSAGALSRIWEIRSGVVTEVACAEDCLPPGTSTLKSFDGVYAFVVPPQAAEDPPQQLALTECLKSKETCTFDRLHFGTAPVAIERAGRLIAVRNDSERQIWLRG